MMDLNGSLIGVKEARAWHLACDADRHAYIEMPDPCHFTEGDIGATVAKG